MLRNLIEIEVERFKQSGYESIVSTETIKIDSRIVVLNIGISTYILSGIVPNSATDENIYINSSISAIAFKQTIYPRFSTSILKKMKDFIIIKTKKDSDVILTDTLFSNTNTPPYYLEFVKITPYKKS